MCFSIGEITKAELGHQHKCSNCGKIVQLPNSSFSSGRVIADDFVIKRKLGSGAMGSVFLAHQLSMDRDVALKVLFYQFTKDKHYAEEFNEEAKAAARINHINVVQSLAFGSDQELLYMAMNYVEGDTFEKLIKRQGKMEIDDALNIVQQVAEGLHAAWTEMQMIHRDIKPANIIITDDGIAKISDFGLARRAHKVNVQTISGSPAYMSPEQFAQKPLDCRSDIYSLGITLFEAITGRLPFSGTNASAVAYKHINEPIPVTKIKPALPRNVKGLIKRMTAKNPDDRFQTPEDLLNRIVEIRKKMAVDKAAVAGVHTMSIKRQSFNEPKRSRQLKTLAEYNRESEQTQKTTNDHRMLHMLTGGLCIVFIFLIIIYLFAGASPRRSRDLKRHLQEIITQIEVVEKDVSKRHENLNLKLEKLTQDFNNSLVNNTIPVLTKINESLADVQSNISKNSKGISTLTKKITTKSRQFSELHEQKGKELEEQTVLVLESYRNMLWYQILKNTGKGNFSTAKSLLISEKATGPAENQEWINARLNEITATELLTEELEKRGKELIGSNISSGKIVAASTSQRTFSVKPANSSKLMRLDWSSLFQNDLTTLLADGWKHATSLNESLKFHALYSLQFASALELADDKKATDAIISAYLEKHIAEVEYLEGIGRKIPKTKARLLEQFKDTRWYNVLKTKLAITEE